MRIPPLLARTALFLLFLGGRPVAAADIAVWVYDFPRWSEGRWEANVAALPPGTRHLYVSVEDGPNFLPKNELQAADLQRIVGALQERPGILTHATILQDTRWLDEPDGARERLDRILELNRGWPERAFAGVHVDLPFQALEDWECGGIPEHRALLQKLQTLLARMASTIPPAGKGGRGRPSLSVALPWWIGALPADIPEASPRRLFENVDEVVLTAYGDPGGPLVGGSAQTLLARLEDDRLWKDVPAGKGIRVGLATYEYASASDLLATAKELDRRFSRQKAYRGTAIFHSSGTYGAPLTASLRGLVRDAAGQPVARARVKIGQRQIATNRCGRFAARDLSASGVTLEVGSIGFQGVSVPVAGLAAGQELEIPPIVLHRTP
jgi:hypothetical protein